MTTNVTEPTDRPGSVSWRPRFRGLTEAPLHPFLFAAYAVLALLAVNVQETPLQDSGRSFAVALALAACAFGLVWLVARDRHKAALIASAFVVVFFTYGHQYDAVRSAAIGGFALGRHRFLGPGLILLIALASGLILRSRRKFQGVTPILNFTAAAALVLALIPIVRFARVAVIQGQNPWGGKLEPLRLDPPPDDPLPDVYYIILDGYARSDYMKSDFGFDNSGFMTFLKERGFYIAEQSRSNYNSTALSLSSSLNSEFVQNLGLPLVPGSYPSLFVEPIRHSRVREALERIGYSTVNLSSGWTGTEWTDAAVYLAPESIDVASLNAPPRSRFLITPFESQLLFTTPLRLVEPQIRSWSSNWVRARVGLYPDDTLREIILGEFENLGRVASIPGPKFVFSHIVAPHSPYLFAASGNPVPREGAFTLVEPETTSGVGGNAARYRDQAIFVTHRIQASIDAILKNSPSRPIIVLQADHGSGAGADWDTPQSPGTAQRTSILNAYLVPTPCIDSLYPSITPVNTFRVLFDCALGTSLPHLPDLTYHTPSLRGNAEYIFTLVDGPSSEP